MTRVYIADSDDSVAKSIAFLLGTENISSRVFTLGEDLLDATLSSAPSCIVVESQLPDITGMGLLRRLRVHSLHTPVILLAAAHEKASAVDALKSGAWDFLHKPFMQKQLVDSVKSSMRNEFLAIQAS